MVSTQTKTGKALASPWKNSLLRLPVMANETDRQRLVREGDEFIALHYAKQLKGKTLLLKALGNKWYRLNALYKIKDKDGKVRRFKPNDQQRQRFLDEHNRDLILKARQLGFTTFEMIDALDDCLFTRNYSAGCICHTLPDAKEIYRNKIRFAYEKLSGDPAWSAILS